MKRIVCIFVILALSLSLSACVPLAALLAVNTKDTVERPVLPEAAPEPQEWTDTIQTPQFTSDPVPAMAQAGVSDAFVDTLEYTDYSGTSTLCYHIPRFDMDTPQMEDLNEEIFAELYDLLENNVYDNPEQPFLYQMCYDWVQVDHMVSLLVFVQADWGISLFRVYNVYADGSGEISDELLLEYFGCDAEAFPRMVKERMEKKFHSMYGDVAEIDGEYYQIQLSKTLSQENAMNAQPFIAADGSLAVVCTIYAMAGGDSYDHILYLTENGDAPYPQCAIVHN